MLRKTNPTPTARMMVMASGALSFAHWAGLVIVSMVHDYQSMELGALLYGMAGSLALMFGALWIVDAPGRGRERLTAFLADEKVARTIVFGALAASWIVVAAVMIPWNDEVSNRDAAQFLFDHGIRDYFRHYGEINSWLGPHHPPLIPLIYAGLYRVFGFSIVVGRVFAGVCSLATAALGYFWLRRRFDAQTALLSVACLLAVPVAVFSGVSSILDAPFWLLFTATLIAFDRFLQNGRNGSAALVGALVALAVLSRYNAILLPPIFVAVIWATPDHRPFLKRVTTWAIVAVPAVLVLPWVILSSLTGTLSLQVDRLASFALTAFIPKGGAFYLKTTLAPLAPFMLGVFNAPLWIVGAWSSWRDDKGRFGRFAPAAAGAYVGLLMLSLPNPRYFLSIAILVAFLTARAILDIERREGRGLTVLGQLLGLAWLNIGIVLHQTGLRVVYLFY